MNLRAALIGSFVLHAGLAAAFGGGFLGGPVRRPAPSTITAEIPVETPLEPDEAPLVLDMPVESAVPSGLPDLLDPPPQEEDARFLEPDEPAGPPAGVIGVSSIDGRRRGIDGAVGGNGRVRAPAPAPAPAVVEPLPEPPAPVPDPVFLPPSLKEDRAPVYPQAVRRACIEGTVRVRVEVEADGSVRGAGVAVSSGNAFLDSAAVEAAVAWVFLPATEDGRAVASVVYRWVAFRLTDGR